jgi:two-component system, chemotaxis family, protein-glutamate methylesterase/glutaminase
MTKIRVLIIDDSAFLRRTLPRLLASDPELEVVGVAADGAEGIRMVIALHPDVVILDVLMPGMDGLEALKQIMRDTPTPVVMLSALTQPGGQETREALALGAADVVFKPSGSVSLDIQTRRDELIEKIKAAASGPTIGGRGMDASRAQFRSLIDRLAPDAKTDADEPAEAHGVGKRLVAIAASTGGPAALEILLPMLPADLAAGIVIVQHISADFTKQLVEWLNDRSSITVREAEHEMPIVPGLALLSPADLHMTVARSAHQGLVVHLSREPAGTSHRPSADVLFRSIAATCAAETCAIILSGMGSDGALGLRAIRARGGWTIAQDEATSLVYGMPARAMDAGAVCRSLPIDDIAAEIIRVVAGGRIRR